jgi:Tfp pilus assembly protein PilN
VKSKRGFSVQRQGEARLAVEVRRDGRGRWTVAQFERVPAGAAPSSGLGRALAREGEAVAWLLDDNEARTSVMALPPLKGRALQRAALGLVARADGGGPESWSVGCEVLGATRRVGPAGDGPKLQDVFIVQAARSLVEGQLAEAVRWGVRPGLMLPAHLMLDQLYRRHGPEGGDHAAWNLVFIGRDASYLSISTRQSVLLTRRLPQDLSQGADPEEYLGRMATEIERSILFARQTEHSPQVERIIVCGDHEMAPRIVDRLQQQGLAPSLYWEIESLFVWGSAAPQPDDLPAVAGALLACEGMPCNLLTERAHRALSAATRRRALIGVGAVGAAAVPLLLVGGLMTARVQGEYLDKANVRLREAQSRAAQAEEIYRAQRVLMARENRIAEFTAARPDLESVLRQVAVLTPPTVVFHSLRLQESEPGDFVLRLEGESAATSGVDAQAGFVTFLDALRACEFAVVDGEPRRMHIKPGEIVTGGERTVFSLELKLKPTVVAEEG